jgi:hypothetical protein
VRSPGDLEGGTGHGPHPPASLGRRGSAPKRVYCAGCVAVTLLVLFFTKPDSCSESLAKVVQPNSASLDKVAQPEPLQQLAEEKQAFAAQVQEFKTMHAEASKKLRDSEALAADVKKEAMQAKAEVELMKQQLGDATAAAAAVAAVTTVADGMSGGPLPPGTYQESCYQCGFHNVNSGQPSPHLQCMCKASQYIPMGGGIETQAYVVAELAGLLRSHTNHCKNIENKDDSLTCLGLRLPGSYRHSCQNCMLRQSGELQCK